MPAFINRVQYMFVDLVRRYLSGEEGGGGEVEHGVGVVFPPGFHHEQIKPSIMQAASLQVGASITLGWKRPGFLSVSGSRFR